jgi:ABC-type sugar transport system ATPase subunit
MASVSFHRVSKRFGAKSVLEDVSFDVPHGEFWAVLGPSGSGKSTLLRLVAGLEDVTAGEIRIEGERVNERTPRERDVAFVFQSYALYPHMTVFENMAFPLKVARRSRAAIRARVQEVAGLLELGDLLARRPRELSGGQRQRVAIGRAVVREPRVFLFDEPLSNLDARLRASTRIELIRLHRRLGTTVLYVTHDQEEAMTLGQRIAIVHDGRLQQVGAPAAIYHRPANRFVAGFIGSPRMNFVTGALDGGRFVAPPLALDARPPAAIDGPLTLGVRPDRLQLVEGGEDLRGEVEVVEDLGRERQVHLRAGDLRLTVTDRGSTPLRPGDVIGVRIDRADLHWFAGERRVEPPDG